MQTQAAARLGNEFLSTPSARRATAMDPAQSESLPYFYPRPPRGGRPVHSPSWGRVAEFLSTPSARRATAPLFLQPKGSRHFYPRPPRGGRLRRDRHGRHGIMISIHALREEGDAANQRRVILTYEISIHALEGGSFLQCDISIHALREEGDTARPPRCRCSGNFYPRSPRGGRPAHE